MIYNGHRDESSRLGSKSIDQMFKNLIEEGCKCSPFVSKAILEVTKSVYGLDHPTAERVQPGQMVILGVKATEPPGKALSQCRMGAAVVTTYAGPEDEEIRAQFGPVALRRVTLCRVTQEALDQGVLLTQEDVARKVFFCDPRTINRDIEALRNEGIVVPTRGQQADIGPGVSHRARIVRLYLERVSHTQIQRRTFHSLEAIQRYIHLFSRVAWLIEEGIPRSEIAFLVQASQRLVGEYQQLYWEFKGQVECEGRLQEIVESAKGYMGSWPSKKGVMSA